MNTILTDEDRQKVFESLPDALEGFMKKWGWLHFAKGIEAAVLAKLAQHADRQRVPDGWKLVPVEPGEWVFADKVLGHDSHPNHKERMRRLYRAMLAAAPEAPAQPEVWFEDRNGASRKTPDDCVRFGANGVPQAVWVKGVRYVSEDEAPAQASAVDERAAFEAWLGIKPCGAAHEFGWAAWQARAALAQKVQA